LKRTTTKFDEIDLIRLKKEDAEDKEILLAILEELIAIEQRLINIEDNTEKD